MSLFVNTNISSLTARRFMTDTNAELSTAFQRLSSGMRINSAADDAAGLQISNRMTSQIMGLDQAVRNANDGISLVQTIEGALQETTNALQRIRVLAIQSQNGINGTADRTALDAEVTALKEEISRIAATTQFNNVNVLTGAYTSDFLVGSNNNQIITVDATESALAGNWGFSSLVGFSTVTIATPSGAVISIDAVDRAMSLVDGKRADLGAAQNRFQSTVRNIANISENVSAARSRIRDTDFAIETSRLTRLQIIQQASTTILSQANQRPQAALSLLQG